MTNTIADTMNPVEHALLLFTEYFQSATTPARSMQILDTLVALAEEMTPAQKDEFTVRGDEMAERYR